MLGIIVAIWAMPIDRSEIGAFKVCGHFCGPGWCNDGWYSEDHDATNFCGPNYGDVEHAIWPFNNPSCSDECCRAHDECCAPNDSSTAGCNAGITECMAKCSLEVDMICTNNGVTVLPEAIMVAMAAVTVAGWCCGGPCSTEEAITAANQSFIDLPYEVKNFYAQVAAKTSDVQVTST